MKNILLLILAFFAVNSYGQGDLSTKVKGQSQTVNGFNVGELQVAYEQATKTGAIKALIETGNDNLLSNPEFEHQSYLQGWTYVQSTGTFSAAPNTTAPLGGAKMVTITASSGTGYIEQCTANGLPGIAGQDGTSEIWVAADATSSQLEVCALRDNVAVNCTNVVAGSTNKYVISAPLTSVCNGVTVKTKAAMTGIFSVDKAKTYLGTPSGKVAQARLHGSVRTAATANCGWQNSGTASLTGFAADPDCPVPTISGNVAAPSTKIPGFVLKGEPGDYEIFLRGSYSATSGDNQARCSFAINDGTTTYDAFRIGAQDGDTHASAELVLPVAFFKYKKTTPGDVTIQVYSQSVATVTNLCQIVAVTVPLNFDVYYYPPSQEIYSSDSLGWFIDANIGGANPNLGTASVATYTEITDAGLDLVVNSAKGSAPARILCSGTNAPGTTTCPAGSESVGLAFTIPKEGQYEVCAGFAHSTETGAGANSYVVTVFQLIETPVNSQTNLLTGEERLQTINRTVGSGNNQNMSFPQKNCATFNFTSVGEKAVRLMYEQEVLNSPNSSSISADRSTALGQRDIHFTVRPAINLEKINGSFKQITDALEEVYVYAHSSSTVVTGVGTTITFATEVFDTASAFNPATGIFTAPVDGVYKVSGTFTSTSASLAATQILALVVRANSISYTTERTYGNGSSNQWGAAGSAIVKLSAGQTLSLQGIASVNLTGDNSQPNTWITISRIPSE